MKKITCAFVMSLFLSSVSAAEPLSPIESFHRNTVAQLLLCRLTMENTFLDRAAGQAGTFDRVNECMESSRSLAKTLFPQALGTVSTKPEATKLLKEYYATWLTALNGVPPAIQERKTDYAQRQTLAEQKAEQAWNRFEIEADL